MNIKQILNSVIAYIGEAPKENYALNKDQNARKLWSMAESSLYDIANEHSWSFLKKEHTITMVPEQNLYDLPTDFDRFVKDTMYTQNYRIDIPSSDQCIAFNDHHGSHYNYKARRRGNQIEFVNVPTGKVTFLYISNQYVIDQNGVSKQYIEDDFDKSLFDPNLYIAAVRQRYQEQIGENIQLATADYAKKLRIAISKDQSARVLNPNEDLNHWPFKT